MARPVPFLNSPDLIGGLAFQPSASNWDAVGTITWTVAANKDRFFPAGLHRKPRHPGLALRPAARGQPALFIPNGTITVKDGGVSALLVDTITINDNNTVTVSGPIDKLEIQDFDPAKGTFTGSFSRPRRAETTIFQPDILYHNGHYQIGSSQAPLGPLSATPDPRPSQNVTVINPSAPR